MVTGDAYHKPGHAMAALTAWAGQMRKTVVSIIRGRGIFSGETAL